MKSEITVLLTILLFAKTTAHAQGMWKPFKLVIIQPDTAIIDKSYYSAADSIVIKTQQQYYQSVKNLEDRINCTDCPKDSSAMEGLKKELQLLQSYESEVQRFKYFHLLSKYSIAVYGFYFNESKPLSTFAELPNQKTDSTDLKTLADTSKADYIVFYSNIHSGTGKAGRPVLKLTTSLYSKKDNKIILKKETEGDTNSYGDLWTCSGELECLFINGVRSSTDQVTGILTKRQKKQK